MSISESVFVECGKCKKAVLRALFSYVGENDKILVKMDAFCHGKHDIRKLEVKEIKKSGKMQIVVFDSEKLA